MIIINPLNYSLMTMKKLLKEYELNSDMQYYEMVVESVINGNRTQAKEQFNAMPREDRKAFVLSLFTDWGTGLSAQDKAMFFQLL
jgi:hypothetical protein